MSSHRKRSMWLTGTAPRTPGFRARGLARAASVAAGGILAVVATSLPAGADGSSSCMSMANKYLQDCPAVEATASIAISGESIRVTVASKTDWDGGPIAVEMSVPDAAVKAPDGAPTKQGKGYANWTSRNGTVISRCAFDPKTRPIKAGGTTECDLQLLGLKDGTHTMWLTGFFGAIPKPDAILGTVPTGQGVVAIATPRSIEFTLKAGAVTLSKPSTVDTKNPPVQVQITEPDTNPIATTTTDQKKEKKSTSGGFPWLPVGGGVAAAAVVGGVIAAKRRSGTPDAE